MSLDPQMQRLISRLHAEPVHVDEGANPEEQYPGLRRAVEKGLVKESGTGSWSHGGYTYKPTRKGLTEVGISVLPVFNERAIIVLNALIFITSIAILLYGISCAATLLGISVHEPPAAQPVGIPADI